MDVMYHEGSCDVAYQTQEGGQGRGATGKDEKKFSLSTVLYLRAPSVQEISVFVRGELADGT